MNKENKKVTIITGASGGIGKAIADQLAGKKQDLLLIARNEEKLQEYCKLLMQRHGVRVFTEVTARGLEVEILINNAGIGSGGDFTAIPLQSKLNLYQLTASVRT